MSEAIRVRGLVKRFGSETAVNGLDLEVRRGECFGLLGPNGAGKTTTLEILEGLQTQTEGEVEVLGRSWARQAKEIRSKIGVVLQETLLSDKLTAEETIELFRSFYTQGPSTEELLSLLRLTEKRKTWVMRLSGGQRQRLAIACGLAGDPELLFLDEPTTGLDPQSRRSLWQMISAFRDRGRTVMLTTHYMDEAEQLCDRIAVVDKGRIIAEGSPAQLIQSLGGGHMVEVATHPPLPPERFEDIAGVSSARVAGERLALSVAQPHLALPAIVNRLNEQKIELRELSTRQATLEDVFVSLTGRHLRD
ncbi:ABC transporter ATP-binding protein [Hyalangium versicolor]|uniref:ABC transporter ATP-binding protein n=1 Tax=Hyalangium versicolor TaxID=2861190 RepID=UPI001CC9E0AE|nr:ABC transporter ATP-binding protein [Hyalangium versicolor]